MNTENISTGFAELGISGALLKAAARAGFEAPKPIQALAIPPHLEGRDILGIAQTGSGKTAAFTMPMLAKIAGLGAKRRPRTAHALILAPTRELAVQIEETIRQLAHGSHVATALVLGGVSRSSQVKKLLHGVDFLVATPGRLTDLVRERDVDLSQTRWLVLDEADRMLDMGFIDQVRRLARATHPSRQTALFSATMPAEIEALAAGLLKEPVRVEVAPQGTTAVEIAQSLMMVPTKQKRKVLSDLLADEAMRSVLVFARTKHGADRVARDLERDGFEAAVIHGNKSQNARQKALNGFRDGEVRILVATDIAARGIDVPGISHVVNFDLPDEPESYVHRIGRTGRNGASGVALTLCDPSENAKLRAVEKVIRMRLPVTRDFSGDGGEPASTPEAANANRPVRAARPPRNGPSRSGKPSAQSRPRGGEGKPKGEAAPRRAHGGPTPSDLARAIQARPEAPAKSAEPARPAGDEPRKGRRNRRRGFSGRKGAMRAA